MRSTTNKYSISLLTIFLFVFALQSKAQNRSSYEKEKQEIEKKIGTTNKILSETRDVKKVSQGELNAINQQIINQTKFLSSIEKEVGHLSSQIVGLQDIIMGMENDLDQLREEYAQMIYASYKTQKNFNEASYLFTSKTYNQLMQRINYLKQFTEARKKQVKKIESVKALLEKQRESLNKNQHQKKEALVSLQQETEILNHLKTQKAIIIKELSKQEKELQQQLDEYQKKQEKLEKLIKDMIEKERLEAIKKASKSKTAEKEQSVLSQNFEANKSRLPWPISKGFVSRKFGKQPHPVIEKVYVNNMGIGLQTSANSPVKSVFNGSITTVAKIPGMGIIIMIKHGEYFTVYAKLKTASVKTGETITTGQEIGTVDTSVDGISEVEFQIWKGKEKLDPEPWLKPH